MADGKQERQPLLGKGALAKCTIMLLVVTIVGLELVFDAFLGLLV
jgi:hypothetical protein